MNLYTLSLCIIQRPGKITRLPVLRITGNSGHKHDNRFERSPVLIAISLESWKPVPAVII